LRISRFLLSIGPKNRSKFLESSINMRGFPFYKQIDSKDCGPVCLKIIAKYYGQNIPISELRNLSETTRLGSSLKNLATASEHIGFRTLPIQIPFVELRKIPLPTIIHWDKKHFVVLYKITKSKIFISDPAHGLLSYKFQEFLIRWIGNNANEKLEKGVALLLEPTPEFYAKEFDDKKEKLRIYFLSKYFSKYSKFIVQLFLGLLAGSILQLLLPFLTQSIVDVGIRNLDINFIYLILASQLFLFIGKTAVEVIRGWILLHLSTRINISLISDFFIKLMALPIAFFDTRLTGDILQRINDHGRIERLITSSSLSVLFSFINLLVFGLVLVYYNFWVFFIFLIGSLLHFCWIILFLKKREELDYKAFSQISEEKSKVIELVNGMQEIKLHNAEKEFRWDWEHLQARLFKISMSNLRIDQFQNVGANFINEFKNILITILAAKLVIAGSITLGMLLAISYIVGQLNSPISDLAGFMRDLQDARISLKRLSEIHNHKTEKTTIESAKINNLEDLSFNIKSIGFKYKGSQQNVLKSISAYIPKNRITAIVGRSGSGKTTMLKVLLKYYQPNEGEIKVGGIPLNNISPRDWREACGVVMQEGFIFSNTIAKNIAVGMDEIDRAKLYKAVEIANIKDFIEELPLSYNTKIGQNGMGLSTGQKQRILIARAVYKDPKCLFFDEATSSLDAENEKIIMENLNSFFRKKTVLIIAHRLSTVKNADQIIVLDKGEIVETGNHESLVKSKGVYYKLVKNQLELGI